MTKKNNDIKFHVLEYNFNSRKCKYRDVIPYFIEKWNDKKLDSFEKSKVKTKEDLKKWIESASRYQFWSRCEYEFLMAPWPLGSYRIKEELKKLDLNDIDKSFFDIVNSFCIDMEKIDIHDQIMMNIDIITELLWIKFDLDNKKSAK